MWPIASARITEPAQQEGPAVDEQITAGTVAKPYDKRRLSYAGTFTNPWKVATIRTIEWATAKLKLLSLIRKFERRGAPVGQAFWPQALEIMGIDVTTPAEQIARIPKEGPLVVVANHPHGLVDGMVLAYLIGQVRTDYNVITSYSIHYTKLYEARAGKARAT